MKTRPATCSCIIFLILLVIGYRAEAEPPEQFYFICYKPVGGEQIGNNPGCIVCEEPMINPDPKVWKAKHLCPRDMGLDFKNLQLAEEWKEKFCGCDQATINRSRWRKTFIIPE